ncbi:cell division protein FtsH4 [Prochlorococcus marinus str. MIT 9515]|uniref:ATP-dependent zinc metalloprotease FtsH n=1 Tax=Prochlorococcus marinus (strain MIT 9515) TaxID=167542 RepID=A2BWH7_PROM5|nr:ATP-dependent zinc metalloprotease FtsH [Prochlorococcus marinus]ABM72138.1 cell division protein FtsH4 [Prochlorococcus marinus str. MIT 9515]
MFFKSNFSYSNSNKSYSDLILELDSGNIESIYFYPRKREIDVLYKNGRKEKVPILYNDQLILEKASENNVDLTINNSRKEYSAANSIASIGLFFIFLIAIVLILRSTSKLASRALGFGKSKSKFVTIDDVDTRFDDVAGVPEAAEELKEVIKFLNEPKRFTDLGAKVPKGVLLIGPPGTGKTLLAKAIAGESGVPFLSIAASEFVELFVGVGASRVRDLFVKAKEKSPCIIFIDEIDSIGRQRGSGIGGGNDEREQTLNQLLTELDGFSDNSGIIVIAATNRPDILDSALLRPGRFDRKIEVMLPDLDGRKKILSVHSLSKPLSKNVDLGYWATRTVGFSGADLANLMNESAIHCAREESKLICDIHIENALDKVTLGLRTSIISSHNMKKIIAYNEVGRAIVSAVKNGIDSVDKITILPRSGYLGGYTKLNPDEDIVSSGLISKKLLLSKIEIALAGRAAETIVFGKNEITQCSINDISYATNIVREMVTKYGFSIIGPLSLESRNNNFMGDGFVRNNSIIADNTYSKIDNEIINISKISLNNAINILSKNRILLDKLVEILINKETIDNNTFKKITHNLLKV